MVPSYYFCGRFKNIECIKLLFELGFDFANYPFGGVYKSNLLCTIVENRDEPNTITQYQKDITQLILMYMNNAQVMKMLTEPPNLCGESVQDLFPAFYDYVCEEMNSSSIGKPSYD
jgi:hypothetical protein